MRTTASLTSYGTGRHMRDEDVVSEYGATPEVLVTLWRLLCPHLTNSSLPHHMLWWLYNCKHYPTKSVLHKALRVSPPTVRKFTKPIKEGFLKIRDKVVRKTVFVFVQDKHISCNLSNSLIAPATTTALSQIRFKDRLKHDKGRTCKIYHDGVDFKCFNRQNPMRESRPEWRTYPFNPSYNSHKFNAAGLRYGISTCIQTGEIVSCHGPFPVGNWPDINIYRTNVKPTLAPG